MCLWAEQNWSGDRTLVARQLGTRRRRWDTIVVETTASGLAARAPFGTDRLDSDLLFVAEHAPSSWDYYRDALPDPGYPWRYVREAIHRAADRGFVETRKRSGRIELRRRYRYPEWVDRIVAIENKPDLDASAARRLAEQLRHDVALGLADEVWLATRADAVDALLEAIPVEVGVLVVDAEDGNPEPPFDDDRVEVVWHPRSLPVEASGCRITGRGDDRTDFEYVTADWKRRKRLEIAERAYERGFRSYVDTMRPDCRWFQTREPAGPLPWCAAKDREPTAAECSGDCSAFEPEPPAWRSRGWPIDGGPGAAASRLLEAKWARRREE
ncbi:MAG: DUF5787 family protein [Natronomonas sp.]